jgi:hypothetical protein
MSKINNNYLCGEYLLLQLSSGSDVVTTMVPLPLQLVFKGLVAATEKKPEPNQTQLQATSFSSCSWASLSMVIVAVGSCDSQVQPVGTGYNWSQQVDFTSLLNLRWYKINFTFYIIYLLHQQNQISCHSK